MNVLIDFSECSDLLNDYEGKAEKFPIIHNGERYMLKFDEAFEEDERCPDHAV